jgi:hypothetical protein
VSHTSLLPARQPSYSFNQSEFGYFSIRPTGSFSLLSRLYGRYILLLLLLLLLLLFIQVYCPYATLGYERPTPHLLTDINIHSDTQAEPRKLSSLTLYIDLWQEGKPAPGQNPPVISPPVVLFRRIGVRAEVRTQNPVLSNTRLVEMVPLSHLRGQVHIIQLESTQSFTNQSPSILIYYQKLPNVAIHPSVQKINKKRKRQQSRLSWENDIEI